MNKRGITLIALVVTILVMIILGAAVVGTVAGIVNLARKDGYETTSKLLRDRVSVLYEEINSEKEENITFENAFNAKYIPPLSSPSSLPVLPAVDGVSGESIDIVKNKYDISTDEFNSLLFYKIDTDEAKEIFAVTDSKLNFWVNIERNLVFSINPLENKGNRIYTLEELDPNYTVFKSNVNIDDIQIGDYIVYDPTKGVDDISKLTYVSQIGSAKENENSPGNGYGVQTVKATSANNQWRVLSKENGEIKIVSVAAIPSEGNMAFYLKDGRGYLYAENELNKACAVFGHATGAKTNQATEYFIGNPEVEGDLQNKRVVSGARSLNLEDIEKLTNIETDADRRTATQTVANSAGLQIWYNNNFTSNFKTRNFPSEPVFLPTLKATNALGMDSTFNEKNFKKDVLFTQFHIPSSRMVSTSPLKNLIFTASEPHWIATRLQDPDPEMVGFGVAYTTDNYVGSCLLYNAIKFYDIPAQTYFTQAALLKPVVTLIKDVPLKQTSNGWEVIQ